MKDANHSQPMPTTTRWGIDKYTTGVLIANGVFLGVGAVILLFAGQRLFGQMLGLPPAAGFLWLLLGVCALALAVLSIAAARTRHGDFILAALITLLVFQVGSALVSFIVGLTSDPTVFANFAPHLILGILLGIALWRSRNLVSFDKRQS